MINRKKFMAFSLVLTGAAATLFTIKKLFSADRPQECFKAAETSPAPAAAEVKAAPAANVSEPKAAEAPALEISQSAAEDIPEDLGKININTATAEMLQQLPGIGPFLSEAITAFREENGPFSGPEGLMTVPGIGPAKFEALAEFISAGDR